MQISESFFLKVSSGNLMSFIFLKDTDTNASSGHDEYQSNVQQLTRLGNFEHLNRRTLPTGDMHRATCKLAREVDIN